MTVSKDWKAKSDFVENEKPMMGNKYWAKNDNENFFRCNPLVVEAVEKLGKAANGMCAQLEVIDIPFDGPNGWMIDDYDGFEHVEVSGRMTWG